MLDTILAGIIGFVTGALASIIAPWVNWGIEKRRQKLQYRRELVRSWREMVTRIQTSYEKDAANGDFTFYEMLEREPEFLSLDPRLSDNERNMVRNADIRHDVIEIVSYGPNTNRVNPIDNFIESLRYRIGKIEEQWDLV